MGITYLRVAVAKFAVGLVLCHYLPVTHGRLNFNLAFEAAGPETRGDGMQGASPLGKPSAWPDTPSDSIAIVSFGRSLLIIRQPEAKPVKPPRLIRRLCRISSLNGTCMIPPFAEPAAKRVPGISMLMPSDGIQGTSRVA